ncbi:MAG: DEAD/DEAH box helicase [Cyclobacteriaceae bacterium]
MNVLRKRSPRTTGARPQWQKPLRTAKKKSVSTVNPELFTKKAIPMEASVYKPSRTIMDLPIDTFIKGNLTRKGYKNPTEIQEHAIQPILDGRNVLGIAQTGTGKTGAFLIPIINKLLKSSPAFQVLIVVPTRELAVQVEEEFKSMAKGTGLSSLCFIGGTSVRRDLSLLRSKVHVVIGTPGRLVDLSQQQALQFNRFTTLVLDEFDRLLDMGFSKDIQYIVKAMTQRQQTVLFSATEEQNQKHIISSLLHDPIAVRVSSGKSTGDHIDQEIINIKPGEKKIDILVKMVRDKSFQKVIVFAETKRGVSNVRRNLEKAGVRVDEIHGNKSQNYRLKALNSFRSGQIQVLVATDVAARGLDISAVTHVINFQPPKNIDSYIHRIGRTGRAGMEGKAYTFAN